MFHEGTLIGPYTLIRKLGRGGFGEVWLAERRAKFVTTKVAVKLPHDEEIDHDAIKQEATLWEQASGHPNILPIIDADEYDGQIVITLAAMCESLHLEKRLNDENIKSSRFRFGFNDLPSMPEALTLSYESRNNDNH